MNLQKKQYRDYCKILDKVIKDTKHKFEYDTFKKRCNNPRQLWNLINEKLGKNKVQSNNITHIYSQDNKETAANSLARTFLKLNLLIPLINF